MVDGERAWEPYFEKVAIMLVVALFNCSFPMSIDAQVEWKVQVVVKQKSATVEHTVQVDVSKTNRVVRLTLV